MMLAIYKREISCRRFTQGLFGLAERTRDYLLTAEFTTCLQVKFETGNGFDNTQVRERFVNAEFSDSP
jgi:hypothetical protein